MFEDIMMSNVSKRKSGELESRGQIKKARCERGKNLNVK